MVLCNISFKDEEILWTDFNSWEKVLRIGDRRLAGRKWLFMKFFHFVRLSLLYSLSLLSNISRFLLFNIYFTIAKSVLDNFPKGVRVRVVRTKK